MKIFIFLFLTLSLFGNEALFDEYCVDCHFKQKITFKQMKAQKEYIQAPPISVVMARMRKLIIVNIDDEDVEKAVITAYMQDYILEPSIDKGICHARCYVQFGTMPSLKKKIKRKELKKIVSWVYDHYD